MASPKPAKDSSAALPAARFSGAKWLEAYGAFAILGALSCPSVGILFGYLCLREARRRKTIKAMSFARVVLGIVALGLIVYSLLFADGLLPYFDWLMPQH